MIKTQKISSRTLLENMSGDMGVIKHLVVGMNEMLKAQGEVLGKVAVDVEQLKLDMVDVKSDIKKIDKRLEFVENR